MRALTVGMALILLTVPTLADDDTFYDVTNHEHFETTVQMIADEGTYLLCGIYVGGNIKCESRVFEKLSTCKLYRETLKGAFYWMCVPGGKR